jgi:hypothetical protein
VKKYLMILALCAPLFAHAASVWDVSVRNVHDDDSFSLTGQLTTDDSGLATSFAGTLSDELVSDRALSLAPLGLHVSTGPGSEFFYDNMFYGPSDRPGYTIEDSFDSQGLLLAYSGGYVNLFADPYLFGFDQYGDASYLLELQGSATFDREALPTVSEPGALRLMALALFGTVYSRRRAR